MLQERLPTFVKLITQNTEILYLALLFAPYSFIITPEAANAYIQHKHTKRKDKCYMLVLNNKIGVFGSGLGLTARARLCCRP